MKAVLLNWLLTVVVCKYDCICRLVDLFREVVSFEDCIRNKTCPPVTWEFIVL